jgi:hypothetical protein
MTYESDADPSAAPLTIAARLAFSLAPARETLVKRESHLLCEAKPKGGTTASPKKNGPWLARGRMDAGRPRLI